MRKGEGKDGGRDVGKERRNEENGRACVSKNRMKKGWIEGRPRINKEQIVNEMDRIGRNTSRREETD